MHFTIVAIKVGHVSPGDLVGFNPQPDPPGVWAMINPQPLPPRY